MTKIKLTPVEVKKENLFIETNHPDYKWIKKHYNDPGVSDGEREFVNFDDSIINAVVGKYKVKYIAANVFPKYATETIAIVGKVSKKCLDVEKLVLCRFLYDGPDSYEVLGVVKKEDTEFNKDGVLVLKQMEL